MKPAALIAIAIFIAPAVSRADLSVVENGKKVTHECKDDVVTISSNSNDVTLTGRCKAVVVDGNDNKITIAAAANVGVTGNSNSVTANQADRIYTPGNDNKVGYRTAIDPKKRPKISNPGNRNSIKKLK